MKLMDHIHHKLLIITKTVTLLSFLSAGDIQRIIIADKSLDTPGIEIVRNKIPIASTNGSF